MLDTIKHALSVASLSLALVACAASTDDPENVSSNDDALVQQPWHPESEVADDAAYAKVLSFFRKNAVRGSFVSNKQKDRPTKWGPDVDIGYAIVRAPQEKGALVILNGRSETFEQYAELAYDLTARGYTLYMLDHRGQGRSSRLLDYDTVGSGGYQKGYVDSFTEYVADLQQFMSTVVLPDRAGKPGNKLFALGHSMGGTVLTISAEVHPKQFDKIVLSSPMLDLDIDVNVWLRLAIWLHPTDYAQGKGPWNPDAKFAGNPLTSSRPRFLAKQAVFEAHRGLRVGGPTYGWIDAALDGMDRARDDAARIEADVLLLRASEDRVVEPGGQAAVCNKINLKNPGQCRLQVLNGSQHEPLIETDAIRRRALDAIVGFLEQ